MFQDFGIKPFTLPSTCSIIEMNKTNNASIPIARQISCQLSFNLNTTAENDKIAWVIMIIALVMKSNNSITPKCFIFIVM